MNGFARLQHRGRVFFNQLDLRGKITVALLAASLFMGTMATLSSYAMVRWQLNGQTQRLLESEMLLDRREIELRLAGLMAQAESLAANTVTANALADSQGRETYLVPLLRNQQLGIPGADLTVTDYRGRTASSTLATPPDFTRHPVFAAMIEHGQGAAVIDRDAGRKAMLVVALPVRYRLTNDIEGGIVCRIPLDSLLVGADNPGSVWLADASGKSLTEHERFDGALVLSAALQLPKPLASLGLRLFLTQNPAASRGVLYVLLAAFMLIGLFVVVGVVAFARFGANFIAASLAEIAAAAELIAASGRPVASLPVRGKDEFGRLSAAFNTMVQRLGMSYSDLEQRVAERTREMEESQQEAQKASNLLHEAVQSIAVGFSIYDENDCLVLCNDAYLNLHANLRELIAPGVRFEDIMRAAALRNHYRDAANDAATWVANIVAQHRQASGEGHEIRLAKGRWLLSIEHRTPSGYIVGNLIEISEFKAISEALRVRDAYLTATLDNLPFMFWLKDTESRFLAVNKVFADACGRATSEEIVGLTDLDVWPRELAERYRKDDIEVMASRRERIVEEQVSGGSEAGWIETYKKPVITPDGALLGTVGVARDISERHIAEARLHDRNEQLDAIFALSPDGFVSFDRKFRVKYANPAFLRMTGFGEADIVGLDENEFSELLDRRCIPTARFRGVAALRALRNADGNPSTTSPRRELIELEGAGKRVLNVGIRMSEARTVSQILYFRDVTHETEVDRMKNEFLSTAAHELRTPMAGIYGFVEIMLNYEFPVEEQREYLGIIYREAQLMTAIINELLDLARIEARRGKDFNFVRLDLRDLVLQASAAFKVPEGRSAPVTRCMDHPLWVRADANKLNQAVGNVLSNAYKYSFNGGPIDIELVSEDIAGDEEGGRLGIRIRDQGIGMTPDQMSRVCERFYRADTSGKIPGTGLGMSIVKEIIDLHHGTIEIESEIGVGTMVTLWLPMDLSADSTASSRNS